MWRGIQIQIVSHRQKIEQRQVHLLNQDTCRTRAGILLPCVFKRNTFEHIHAHEHQTTYIIYCFKIVGLTVAFVRGLRLKPRISKDVLSRGRDLQTSWNKLNFDWQLTLRKSRRKNVQSWTAVKPAGPR